MKNFGETKIMGGSGEKPKGLGPLGKDFKQMFLEVIATSPNPQERLSASQMLKNVGFEIGADDKEKARIVIEHLQEEQRRHAQATAESMAKMKAGESQMQEESIEELREKISHLKTEKPKHPVMMMPAIKPKSGQNPITPLQ